MNGKEPDRLTKLEATVGSLAESVASLADSVKVQGREIGQIATKLGAQGKWSTSTILAFLGGLFTLFISLGGFGLAVVATLGAAIWTLGIVPLHAAAERNAGDTRLVWENTEKRLAEVRDALKPMTAIPAYFRELETQFDGVTKMRESQWDTINRLVVPLWKKTFDIDLPMPGYHPEPSRPTAPTTSFGGGP